MTNTDDTNKGFLTMGDRGSEFATNTYNQYQILEEGYKNMHIDLVDANDKKAQNKSLMAQRDRSNYLLAWKDAMKDSFDTWSEKLLSNATTPWEWHVLNEIHSQKNSSIRVNENSELEFLIPDINELSGFCDNVIPSPINILFALS